MNEIEKSFISSDLSLPLFVFGAGIILLAGGIVIWQIIRLNKRLDRIFEGGKAKDLEEVLSRQVQFSNDARGRIKELFGELRELRRMATQSIQKVGVVRYNPFQDTGGDQSFVIALLDAEDNGLVLSSLHARQETRIYTKPIVKGASPKYPLSEEEKEAIKRARAL